MIVGNKVKLVKDIVVDKYHNGYVVFPKGSVFIYDGIEKVGLNKVFSPIDVIDSEQPRSVILQINEYEFVE